MIAVPWFKFPWTFATADLAHALAQSALDGDAAAKGQLEEILAQANGGNKLAIEAWRYFSAIIRMAADGQPPPSVLRQMKAVVGVGHHHGGMPGGVMMGPGWGSYEPYPYPGSDPWMFEEMEYQGGW